MLSVRAIAARSVSIRSMCSFMDCQTWSYPRGTMAFRHSCTLGTEFGVRKELVKGEHKFLRLKDGRGFVSDHYEIVLLKLDHYACVDH